MESLAKCGKFIWIFSLFPTSPDPDQEKHQNSLDHLYIHSLDCNGCFYLFIIININQPTSSKSQINYYKNLYFYCKPTQKRWVFNKKYVQGSICSAAVTLANGHTWGWKYNNKYPSSAFVWYFHFWTPPHPHIPMCGI